MSSVPCSAADLVDGAGTGEEDRSSAAVLAEARLEGAVLAEATLVEEDFQGAVVTLVAEAHQGTGENYRDKSKYLLQVTSYKVIQRL